jgi:small GTP-binding protein
MDATLKVVTVGESGVGKTSIVNRFLNASSSDVSPTVGAFSFQCTVRIEHGREIILNVWDTAGQEQFRAMVPLYLRNARACLYVFDSSHPPPLSVLEAAIKDLKSFLDQNTLLFLCGNKLDLIPDIEGNKELEEWAREKKIPFHQTSAVSGEGVASLFQTIATAIADYRTTVDIDRSLLCIEPEKRKPCC